MTPRQPAKPSAPPCSWAAEASYRDRPDTSVPGLAPGPGIMGVVVQLRGPGRASAGACVHGAAGALGVSGWWGSASPIPPRGVQLRKAL